jgi:hypothetical protein
MALGPKELTVQYRNPGLVQKGQTQENQRTLARTQSMTHKDFGN